MLLLVFLIGLRPGPVARPPEAANTVYEVPYRLSSTGHILIRAKLNGKGPYTFIMDTGAPTLIVGTDVAEECGASHAANASTAIRDLEIEGGPVLRGEPALVIDPFQLKAMNSIGLMEQRLAGVVGYTLLARFRLEVDLSDSHMRWTALDYKPQPVVSLMTLTGGKPLKAAPSQEKMEGMASMAAGLLGTAPPSRVVLRGFLGIVLAEGDGAPVIRQVLTGSKAAQAGFKPADRITFLQQDERDPVPTPSVTELLRAASKLAAGEKVSFTVERGEHHLLLVVRAERGGL